MESSVLTLAEVAERLRCSKGHVSHAINGKLKNVTQLPTVSMGRRRLVRVESLEAWLRENDSATIRASFQIHAVNA